MLKRKKYINIWNELSKDKPLVFISGPRQSGKTTLSELIAENFKNSLYFNYDIILNKQKIITDPLFFEKFDRKDSSTPLIILDEIHKHEGFKNYLKGLYDGYRKDYKFLILGSGKSDVYRKGGESLAGRYMNFRLFPLTISEMSKNETSMVSFLKNPFESLTSEDYWDLWIQLSKFSGFPEPFLKSKKAFYNRWSNSYHQQIIRDDILSVNDIRKPEKQELLFSLLPTRVGSYLSLDGLAGDVGVSFNTVKNWIGIFESLFLCFRIPPWTKRISRAITKEKKLYLYDYAIISEPAGRFENMVALELYRAVTNWNDIGFGNFSLHYLRNKEKQEVDFLIADKNKPIILIETKLNETGISENLIKFQNILLVPAIQLVNREGVYRIHSNNNNKILVITAPKWLSALP